MASPNTPPSDILEKVQCPLEQLGVHDAQGLADLFAKLEALLSSEVAPIVQGVADAASVESLRVRWLGRKQGIVRSITDNWLSSAPRELKREVGAGMNALREKAEQQIESAAATSVAAAPVEKKPSPSSAHVSPLSGDFLDISLPGSRRTMGSRHPLRIVVEDITEIFMALGYSVEEGPEIESTYFNFEALNIPEHHPSRDDQDTFYIDPKTVLRTHTSPVQVRTMQRQKPPVRIIVPGKAYRHDAPDATHSPVFHQVEGLAVDSNISLADLKGTLDYFLKAFFGSGVRTRLRPSFFPFTEPSAEVDMSCLFCGGGSEGCRICKQSGWIELGGCGMVDPALYSYVNYDPTKVTGFAFGMGLERLAMLKYGIPDIQLFYQGDIRFLHQFR